MTALELRELLDQLIKNNFGDKQIFIFNGEHSENYTVGYMIKTSALEYDTIHNVLCIK